MWKIIDIKTWDNIVTNQELELDILINKWLEITPEIVQKILQTWVRDISTVWNNEFKQLVIDYVINNLKKRSIDINTSISMWINYLWDLLFKFLYIKDDSELNNVISNPYFIHWAWLWEYKKAWDASVYKYIFWSPNHRDTLTREEYINFAMSWYFSYFWDRDFANSVWVLLPVVWNITREHDFFRRDFLIF